MDRVQIFGDGVAASCCIQLLEQAGIARACSASQRPKVPAIMLGQTAQKLLTDVSRQANLFEGATPIRDRTIAWGASGRIVRVPHSAVVVSEQSLLDRLRGTPDTGTKPSDGPKPKWTVFAERTQCELPAMKNFGSRFARASEVTFAASGDLRDNSCYLESLNEGWLFALPAGEGRGWLLSVGGNVDELLAQSRLVAPRLKEVRPMVGEFPCHPRIADPIAGEDWLLCGTAATGFDPLCGDGAGFAAREAILASAVVQAVVRGGDAATLLNYYQSGILAGFRKHLAACRDFYREGNRGLWWQAQCDELERGIAWCDGKLQQIVRAPWALRGFELVPLT